MSKSKLAFLSNGVTKADLRAEQNSPVDRDKLMIKVRNGRNVEMQVFSILVGRGSDKQVVLGDVPTTLPTSSSVTGLKALRGSPVNDERASARCGG